MSSDKRPEVAPQVEQGARLLSAYLKSGRQRTDLLRALAEVIVELRQLFQLKDGRPDLGGRSPEYRAAVRGIYQRAHVPADDYDGVQTALRYHVNNLLHELHDGDALTAAGLGEKSAKERLAADREAAAALRAALKDQLLLADRIHALTEYLEPESLAADEALRARAARQALDAAAERIAATVAAIDKVHPRRGRKRV